jgi:4-hydroxyacetophenone monooxygenase
MTTMSTEEYRAGLRSALGQAEPPILLMCYVQMTGDTEYVETFRPYIKKVRAYADNIPQDMIDDLHARMERLLCDTPDVETVDLSPADLKRMIDICVGEEVPEAYVPLLLADLGLDTKDIARLPKHVEVSGRFPKNFRMTIVGAGFGGICAGIYCKRAGIDFEILEKNEGPGGTWYENTYPNCGVDAPNHLYSYSFHLKHDWSRYFVRQPEIQAYIAETSKAFGLEEHIRYGQRATAARYDEEAKHWVVEVADKSGETRQIISDGVILSCGQLNSPSIPNIPGLDTFKGQYCHTAEWDHSMDIKGKRVALIGVGASAVQVGPGIAGDVGELFVYQRSAQWVNQRANYTREITDGKIWALGNIPNYARWYRFQLLWAFSDGLFPALQKDPSWDSNGLSINPINHELREQILGYIASQLEGRPDLLAKCTPDYPPYSRRPLFDNGWFDMLKMDHVHLCSTGVTRIEGNTIYGEDGSANEVDVIVFATGFHAAKMLPFIDVYGKDGHTIRRDWGDDDPKAYLGITVPNYPNMFLVYGPNTNYAHGGSIVFNIECQVRYIVNSLEEMAAKGARQIEVRQDAHDRYNAKVEERHEAMIWTQPKVRTWYKNAKGRVVANAPWSMLEYWRLTGEFEPQDYTLS